MQGRVLSFSARTVLSLGLAAATTAAHAQSPIPAASPAPRTSASGITTFGFPLEQADVHVFLLSLTREPKPRVGR